MNYDGIINDAILEEVKDQKYYKDLLIYGANVDEMDDGGKTPLMNSIWWRLNLTDFFLQNGANPNHISYGGDTPLHIAVMTPSTKDVQKLLEVGADPNIPNNLGNTPLHYAAQRGNERMVQLLVEHGADIDPRNNNNKTPLFMAVMECESECVDFLLKNCANPDILTKKGATPRSLLQVKQNKGELLDINLNNYSCGKATKSVR
jgi:ankyrin repeat protein